MPQSEFRGEEVHKGLRCLTITSTHSQCVFASAPLGEKRLWADSKPYLGGENEWVSMIDLHHIQTLAT
jgi:hypothetical protein